MWYSSAAAFLRWGPRVERLERNFDRKNYRQTPKTCLNCPDFSPIRMSPLDLEIKSWLQRTVGPFRRLSSHASKSQQTTTRGIIHINPCRGYFSLLSFPLIFPSLFPLYHRTLTSTSHLSVVTSINHVYRASARNLPCPRHFCR